MKTRKLLALLLVLPLLAYCTKPDPDNGKEQGQGEVWNEEFGVAVSLHAV